MIWIKLSIFPVMLSLAGWNTFRACDATGTGRDLFFCSLLAAGMLALFLVYAASFGLGFRFIRTMSMLLFMLCGFGAALVYIDRAPLAGELASLHRRGAVLYAASALLLAVHWFRTRVCCGFAANPPREDGSPAEIASAATPEPERGGDGGGGDA